MIRKNDNLLINDELLNERANRNLIQLFSTSEDADIMQLKWNI
jgi:hypothetical protein